MEYLGYIWSGMALVALSVLYWQYVPNKWLKGKTTGNS